MSTVQILGLIMAIVGMICGTAIIIVAILNKQNNRHKADQAEKDRAQSAWNNTFNCESLALYEQERQMRIEAETREGIVRCQLKRERKENERLKSLVAVLEGRA